MIRAAVTVLVLGAVVVGCADNSMNASVVWTEGEAYVDGPRNLTEGVGAKAPASGGKALYGAVLGAGGGFARYRVNVPNDVVNARLVVRYARYHWREMDPATVKVSLLSKKKIVRTSIVFGDTGGWGTTNKRDWALAIVDIGTMPAGDWIVRFDAPAEQGSDVNIDGFFLAPGWLDLTAAEMAAADRIHITSSGFVGIGVPRTVLFQQQAKFLELPIRAFRAMTRGVKVTVLDDNDQVVAELINSDSAPLDVHTRLHLLSAAKLQNLPDGPYTLRTAWTGAPVMDLPMHLAGELASRFETRLAAIDAVAAKLRTRPNSTQYLNDYEHAVEYLTAAWKKVLDGTADKSLLASVRRTVEQYEQAGAAISAGQPPFARRTGDLRLAFRSEATGRLEQYRLFVPDDYSPSGSTPLLMALNHNENNYLDQADGLTKTIANQRGYAILSPGPVGTDKETAEYTGDGEKDLAQLLELVLTNYPGFDRKRVYGAGASRGGFGTYSFATAHPDKIVAIACSSGTGNWDWSDGKRTLVKKFAPVPTLILHGEIDTLVPPETARTVAEHLAEQGIPHELHVFPSYGHNYEKYAEQYLTMSLDFFEKHTDPKDMPAPAPAETDVDEAKPAEE